MELEQSIDFDDLIDFDTIFFSDDRNSDRSPSILQTSSQSSSLQTHVNDQSPLSVDDIEQFFMNDQDDVFSQGSVLDEFIRENLLDKSGEVANISDDVVNYQNDAVVDHDEGINSNDDTISNNRKRQQRDTDVAPSSQESENSDLDGFVNDLLIDSPLEGEKSSEVVDLSDDSADDQTNSNQNEAALVNHKERKQNSSENDDPLDKKRKRQLRNKDAALKSRERKKMYVKELEMKSKYYEGECRRLGSILQCIMAENQAFRFSLHTSTSNSSNKAFNASMTKQESAVLFLESLLLGSLLWLISIVCQLVVLPNLHQQSQLVTVVEEKLPNPGLRKEGTQICRQTLLMGKQFKASRSRMRPSLQHLQVLRNILAVL
ncbi:uncharacterized protein [Rutidosis leptorrhynchoides]|uniref:uncharacterized protein n=1 Tax=Rutidosis leptorrhynchoides TaxID=125765 RepID=UPI003A99CFBE